MSWFWYDDKFNTVSTDYFDYNLEVQVTTYEVTQSKVANLLPAQKVIKLEKCIQNGMWNHKPSVQGLS